MIDALVPGVAGIMFSTDPISGKTFIIWLVLPWCRPGRLTAHGGSVLSYRIPTLAPRRRRCTARTGHPVQRVVVCAEGARHPGAHRQHRPSLPGLVRWCRVNAATESLPVWFVSFPRDEP